MHSVRRLVAGRERCPEAIEIAQNPEAGEAAATAHEERGAVPRDLPAGGVVPEEGRAMDAREAHPRRGALILLDKIDDLASIAGERGVDAVDVGQKAGDPDMLGAERAAKPEIRGQDFMRTARSCASQTSA